MTVDILPLQKSNQKKIKILKSIPGNNSHGPKWSPKGNSIIFSYFRKYHWSVGLVGKDYSGFRVLFAPVESVYSPNWRDSNTIVCHNNILLFLTNLHGSLINQIPLNHLHVSAGKSSAAEFVYSKSGRYILFDAHTEYFFAKLFGPISALYLYDEKNDTSKRITSPEICAVNHAWMSDETVLFEGFENSDIEVPVGDYYKIHRRIYKVNIRNNKTNILIEDAADPSVSIK